MVGYISLLSVYFFLRIGRATGFVMNIIKLTFLLRPLKKKNTFSSVYSLTAPGAKRPILLNEHEKAPVIYAAVLPAFLCTRGFSSLLLPARVQPADPV